MTIPLRHFVVGLGFALAGVLVGLGIAVDVTPGFGSLAHVHLLLAGWICVTIMGAMTQFVPVWSGVTLHSRRLASVQLTLVAVGLVGYATALLLDSVTWLIPFGGLMLLGFWTFVYNIGRTMALMDAYDVTERHFLVALGFFALLTVMGFLLAVDFTAPVFEAVGIVRTDVIAMHATLAVFGAVLTTVYGALYQLGTMFTQTDLHGIDEYLRPIEAVGHPIGVVLLAGGRFVNFAFLARIGGLLVVGAALAFGTILARKLVEMEVAWTPMHTRYAVVAPALLGWALLTLPAWLRTPTGQQHLLGAAGAVHLLLLGTLGFVVAGTLYHIIPFIIWVDRYSDLLGLEDVPMIDDLYSDGLAAADATFLVSGTLVLGVAEWFHLAATVSAVGGILVTVGIIVFGTNMLLVIHEHSPQPLGRVLAGALYPRSEPTPTETGQVSEDTS